MTASLIHLGLAKTATTYLQRHVFPQARGVNYLGKPFRASALDRLNALAHFRRSPALGRMHRDEGKLRIRAADPAVFEPLERQLAAALCPRRLNIWSHEGLLRPTRDGLPFDRLEALRNIRSVFAEAGSDNTHALIVLRDTRTLMASYARQFFREVEMLDFDRCSLDDIARLRTGRESNRLAELMWDIWYSYFDFAALIADMRRVFGDEHVHLLSYERLTRDWGELGELISALHSGATLAFPRHKVNETARKPATMSPALISHLRALDTVDLSRLYPENGHWLDLVSRPRDGSAAGLARSAKQTTWQA